MLRRQSEPCPTVPRAGGHSPAGTRTCGPLFLRKRFWSADKLGTAQAGPNPFTVTGVGAGGSNLTWKAFSCPFTWARDQVSLCLGLPVCEARQQHVTCEVTGMTDGIIHLNRWAHSHATVTSVPMLTSRANIPVPGPRTSPPLWPRCGHGASLVGKFHDRWHQAAGLWSSRLAVR